MIRNPGVIKTLLMVVRHHHPYPVFCKMVHYFLLQDPPLSYICTARIDVLCWVFQESQLVE